MTVAVNGVGSTGALAEHRNLGVAPQDRRVAETPSIRKERARLAEVAERARRKEPDIYFGLAALYELAKAREAAREAALGAAEYERRRRAALAFYERAARTYGARPADWYVFGVLAVAGLLPILRLWGTVA